MNIAGILGALIFLVVVATVADRLKIAYPILLVLGGVVIALLPIHHRFEFEPDLILLLFLPPLIYDASLETSIGEIRTHWRPILLLAVGLVLATMTTVAVAVHAVVPSMSWPVAFTLGAIVSPPDAIAATQIAGKLGLNRRLVTILGGEGLMNDATALTAYELAVATVASGFTLAHASEEFAYAVVVGLAIGIGIGIAGTWLLRLTRTPVIENTMLLILPFSAYLPADTIHASGVLAVVAAGLWFGRFGARSLSPAARLQQREIWDLIVFLLAGMSFLLVGLDLHPIIVSLIDRDTGSLLWEAGVVVSTVIVTRILWVYGRMLLPGGKRVLDQESDVRSWKEATVVGWAGMRGAISLALALALPLDFPERNLVVFLTFSVILVTLVGQGLTLPLLIRRLHLTESTRSHRTSVAKTRHKLTLAALHRIDELADEERFPASVLDRIRDAYESQLGAIEEHVDILEARVTGLDPEEDATDPARTLALEKEARAAIIECERAELEQLVRRGHIEAEVAEAVKKDLDVDETTMRP